MLENVVNFFFIVKHLEGIPYSLSKKELGKGEEKEKERGRSVWPITKCYASTGWAFATKARERPK